MDSYKDAPTNDELYRELQELKHKVNKLEFDLECLKAEQEKLKRPRY